MYVDVDEATEQEKAEWDSDKVYTLRISAEEAQVLRAILGSFRSDIELTKSWDDELELAGVERVNLKVVAFTETPFLFFKPIEE